MRALLGKSFACHLKKKRMKLSAVRFQKRQFEENLLRFFCENGFYDNFDRKTIQVPTFELTVS